jgi:predicted ATPase
LALFGARVYIFEKYFEAASNQKKAMPSSQEQKLRDLLANKELEPFIGHIRFPQYKNLASNTKIDFSYPITALVGANGTNKSSILRALYGAPENNNLGNFWFSTSIDPIKETGNRASCFIYGYWNASEQKIVEVIKTRIKKEEDPDYWEPSRPLLSYEMAPPPKLSASQTIPEGRSRTRWNAIKKDVVYIDFRSALSAFDKFFYHGELRSKPNTEKNKKDFIRVRAVHLKKALDDQSQSYVKWRHDRIVDSDNSTLSADEITAISHILGRKYEEIRYVRHTFFNCDAYTCLMRIAGLKYTEAFAGSGEFAVVKIVTSVLRAKEKSLILLDEPEVSLHPGAQDRLVDFLTSCVKLHKHQVVTSTHSPSIIRKLPPDAIKVLTVDTNSNRVAISRQSSLPEEAFFHLGEPVPNKITVLVEDVLAQAIINRALMPLGEAAASVFDIRYFPGGSQTLWSSYVPTFAAENRARLLVLFDGDKRPTEGFSDPTAISEAEVGQLRTEILRVTGVDIDFPCDGGANGGNVAQQNEMRRTFMKWARSQVSYLPGTTIPEAFVWDNMQPDNKSQSIADTNPKVRFEKLAKLELGVPNFKSVTSADILATQRRRLATIAADHPDLVDIKTILLSFAISSGLTVP